MAVFDQYLFNNILDFLDRWIFFRSKAGFQDFNDLVAETLGDLSVPSPNGYSRAVNGVGDPVLRKWDSSTISLNYIFYLGHTGL